MLQGVLGPWWLWIRMAHIIGGLIRALIFENKDKNIQKVGICFKNSKSREPKNPTEEDPGPAWSSAQLLCSLTITP